MGDKQTMTKIGQGTRTSGGACSGVLRQVDSVKDVLGLLKQDVSEAILLTPTASATIMTPLFPRIKGVVCTTGGATSHVAIVAREFNLTCVMAADIDFEGQLEGARVNIDADGQIFLEG
jgi:phosphocarrier protein FPr